MTTAYLCVVFCFFLPVLLAGYAKLRSGFKPRDNARPRAFLADIQGEALRARWAEQNTYEALPAFFAAVIIAHQMQAPQATVDALALAFVVLRVVYAWCYVSNRPSLRSLVWMAGLGCTVALVFVGA